MPELPNISLIVPTYDEPHRLVETLGSLARQDYPAAKTQIVVVDDASRNFAADPVRRAGGDANLVLIRNETNQGRARSRNRGIQAADGELLIFLDSDMTVGTNFLDAHAHAHATLPDRVAIGNIRFGDAIPENCLTRYIASRGVHRLRPGEEVPFKCFVTGNSSIDRNQLLQVGLFDEDFRRYGGEDLELGYRLHRNGIAFQYVPQALSLHNHLRPFDQNCTLMRTYGTHSLPILVEKHPELVDLLHLGFTRRSSFSPGRLCYSLALASVVYAPLQTLARVGMNFFVPDLVFEYVWWYHRTRGYLDRLQDPAPTKTDSLEQRSACA